MALPFGDEVDVQAIDDDVFFGNDCLAVPVQFRNVGKRERQLAPFNQRAETGHVSWMAVRIVQLITAQFYHMGGFRLFHMALPEQERRGRHHAG